MLYNFYMYLHNTLHLCFWEFTALLLGALMIIMIIVHRHNQKKREQEFIKEFEADKIKTAEQ